MTAALTALGALHQQLVFNRRVRVLSQTLAGLIPSNSAVLDIGCGSGVIGHLVQQSNPSLTVTGLEVFARPTCHIPYQIFDGQRIPHADNAVDVCLFVDVLHHTADIDMLLREANRVSRQYVLIKDHLCENTVDRLTLRFMDWVGNRPHGVVLPYNYQSAANWQQLFAASGLQVLTWLDSLPLYPIPFSYLFGRRLHFVALLDKASPA